MRSKTLAGNNWRNACYPEIPRKLGAYVSSSRRPFIVKTGQREARNECQNPIRLCANLSRDKPLFNFTPFQNLHLSQTHTYCPSTVRTAAWTCGFSTQVVCNKHFDAGDTLKVTQDFPQAEPAKPCWYHTFLIAVLQVVARP